MTDAVAWPATLATSRLHVRPVTVRDRVFHAALTGDAEVMRHVGQTLDASAAGHKFDAIMRAAYDVEPRRMHAWRLDPKDGGQGGDSTGIGLMTVALRPGTSIGELGLLFAAGQHARGYAAEVVTALLAAVAPSGRLQARHRPDNRPVERLMTRMAFRRDGDRDGYVWWSST